MVAGATIATITKSMWTAYKHHTKRARVVNEMLNDKDTRQHRRTRRHLATISRNDISLVEPDDVSYTHTIEADYEGEIELAFTHNGKNIKDSPVTIQIAPNASIDVRLIVSSVAFALAVASRGVTHVASLTWRHSRGVTHVASLTWRHSRGVTHLASLAFYFVRRRQKQHSTTQS